MQTNEHSKKMDSKKGSVASTSFLFDFIPQIKKRQLKNGLDAVHKPEQLLMMVVLYKQNQ
ncbi:hypothetical protein P4T04_16835 [Bacillus badius]|uniref:hypothetical protein n=1 Tax=Bacillus badius TaxID=1455 RepID=UPI000597E447|nr:hypothetical protein [Bacillus badius]KZO01097.1 hypothetical protein A4244_13800 [Bacillus badius]KZR59522.1 hypothetical protein A3781_12165 [Bacillus badius]MED0667961.1 hypothetical protein [Bacillus badius]OCS89148.1 hypothetical protein A6M11_13820 [Bacillus badius]OVE50912.1 hypothetical protein B1A98_14955 [Bacillus badius]